MLLELDSVSVTRGNTPVLQAITCQISSGKLVALVGENGAGKSTLLHAIAGSLAHKGKIEFLGKTLCSWKPEALARHRAVMLQQNHLSFQFSVPEFIAMGRFAIVEPTQKKQQRVADYIHLLSLQDLVDRHTGQLSGGQLQRVNMARCLAQIDAFADQCQSKLLLLDEPTSALDLRFQHQLLAQVKRFTAQGNSAIVAIHDLNLASLYADEVMLLNQGKLAGYEPAHEALTARRLEPIYQTRMHVEPHPSLNIPMIFSQPAETDNESTSIN